MENVAGRPDEIRAWSEIVPGPFEEVKVREAALRVREHLGGKADILFVFASCDLRDGLDDLVELLQIHAHCPRIIGCSAGGLIGTAREDEGFSGFSFLALRTPGAEIFCAEIPAAPDYGAWNGVRQWGREGCTGWIVLGNPTQLGEDWIAAWNSAVGSTPSYGGLASGGHRGDELFIFNEQGESSAAAIAIGLRGSVKLAGIVSQGCRPIGEPLTITRAENNLIHQLACQRAYDQLQTAFQTLTETEREKAQGNILVGLAMSEYVDDFHTGDFLVRSILGGDPGNGALALGAIPRVGQTLQFQLRDHESAHEDLHEMLLTLRSSLGAPPFAGLLFSCGGRGKNLFGKPNHDAGLVEQIFPGTPLAGLHCNGEIGSVGGKAHLHGFTASAAFFVKA